MSSAASAHRMTFIDGLRGLAAISVVLYHAKEGNHISELLERLPHWFDSVLRHCNLGVAIFFVLSGFVISHSLRKQEMTLATVGRFMLRRSIRLDPPYWTAIAITIGFGFLASRVVKEHAPSHYSLGQIVAHLFYAQDLLGYANINAVFWTLCFEVQFYLVFALLLSMGLGGGGIWVISAISLLWPFGLIGTINGLFVSLWYAFLLGVAAYRTLQSRRLYAIFLAFSTAVLVCGVVRSDAFAIASAATAFGIVLAGMTGRLSGGLNWRWLQFLGLISYSLYLIHNPITGATFRIGYTITGRGPLLDLMWWAVSTGASIIAAALMWWLIERPSIALSKKFSLAGQLSPSIPAARSQRN